MTQVSNREIGHALNAKRLATLLAIIRREIRAQACNTETLADDAGVTQQTIYNIINEKVLTPRSTTIAGVARALGLQLTLVPSKQNKKASQ